MGGKPRFQSFRNCGLFLICPLSKESQRPQMAGSSVSVEIT